MILYFVYCFVWYKGSAHGPKWTSGPPKDTLLIQREGSKAIFKCRANGNPRPSVKWMKDGQTVRAEKNQQASIWSQRLHYELFHWIFDYSDPIWSYTDGNIELLQSRVSFASLHIIFLCCCFYFAYSRKFTCGFVVNLYSSLQQGSQIWIKTILDNKTFVFLFYLWYIKILFSFFVMLSLLFLFLQYRKSKWKLQINSVTTDNSGNYTCIITNPSGQLKWTYTLRVLGKSLKTFNRLRQGINFNFYGRVCFETLFWNH